MNGPFTVDYFGGERTCVFDSDGATICVAENEIFADMVCAALNAVHYIKEASEC